MATIRELTGRRGRVTYNVQVRTCGQRTSRTFTTLRAAERWAAATDTAARDGEVVEGGEARKRTLAELIDRYAADWLPRKRDRRTQELQLEWWKDRLGTRRLATVTAPVVIEYRDLLSREGRAAGTVNRYLAVLSHCFTVGVREYHWLRANPVKQVSRMKEPRGRTRFLSDDERTRLLKACRASESPHLYAAVLLSLSTGGRQAEVMGLRWPDVDFDQRVVKFMTTKNGTPRAVPVTGEALTLLRSMSKVRRIDGDLLFAREDGKAPIELRKPWLEAVKQAKLDGPFRWHDMRHCAGSWLAMSGASQREIQEVLGHRTPQMAARYSHLTAAHVENLVERMTTKFLA